MLKDPPPYMSAFFSGLRKDMTSMISCILGFSTNEYLVEIIFSYMSIFTPRQPLAIKFDYAKFISEKMHGQFLRLENERVFKYSSVLYHLFLYYQTDKFPFVVQKLDYKGNPRSILFWKPLFHRYNSPYPYTDFIDLFVHPMATMLLGSPRPRINADIRRVLQLSKQYKVGDWYMYQNHTGIRIYGCELPPYKLPRYLPMRLFSLEYYRKIINSDEVHFVRIKKKAQLRIKDHLGPFICNNREAGREVDEIL